MKVNRYFDYLCARIGAEAYNYTQLLDELHNIEFYSLIPNDHNRGSDGNALRDEFIEEVGPTWTPSLPRFECSVLEMMIGLSYRLEFETALTRWEKTPSEWFWVLVDNLGLTEFTDANMFNSSDHIGNIRRDINGIVACMLSRCYDYNGYGGLFPLRRTKKDQRRVEIWYQMSAYILENYPML